MYPQMMRHCKCCHAFFVSKRRRRILNEEDLVEAVESFTDIDLIDFVGMSMKEQVSSSTYMLWKMFFFLSYGKMFCP